MEGNNILAPKGAWSSPSTLSSLAPQCRCCAYRFNCPRAWASGRLVGKPSNESFWGKVLIRRVYLKFFGWQDKMRECRSDERRKTSRKLFAPTRRLCTLSLINSLGKRNAAGKGKSSWSADSDVAFGNAVHRSQRLTDKKLETGTTPTKTEVQSGEHQGVGSKLYDNVAGPAASQNYSWKTSGTSIGRNEMRIKRSTNDRGQSSQPDNKSSPVGSLDEANFRVAGVGIGKLGNETSDGEKSQFHDEQWRSIRFNIPSTVRSIANIPTSELQKIKELKFSGDLHEGDSGPQVLNLQRALFWLGHLPGSSLSGYFGPDTSKALDNFHATHGVPCSSSWGIESQQALWNYLVGDSSSHAGKKALQEDRENDVIKDVECGAKDTDKLLQNRIHLSRDFCTWCSKTLPDYLSYSLPPHWNSVSGKAGMALLAFLVLSSMTKLWSLMFQAPQGQPVKRRVMSWRNEMRLDDPVRKRVRTPQDVMQGPRRSSESEGTMNYSWKRVRSQPSVDNGDETGNVLDRLVLFEGQVIRGEFSSGKLPQNSTEDLQGLSQNGYSSEDTRFRTKKPSSLEPIAPFEHNMKDSSRTKLKENGSGPILAFQTDNEIDFPYVQTGSTDHYSYHREVQSRLPRMDQLPVSPPRTARPTWAGKVIANLFPQREQQSPVFDGLQKRSFRRGVSGHNSLRQVSPSERAGTPERPASLRSWRKDKDLIVNLKGSRWHAEDEYDLKKRIEELHNKVESVEQTRQAAMRALEEEKMRSLELQVKISRQKEAAASLEEEVRVLKESHSALLISLRKKYSSTAAARAAADLLYQNWDSSSDRSVAV